LYFFGKTYLNLFRQDINKIFLLKAFQQSLNRGQKTAEKPNFGKKMVIIISYSNCLSSCREGKDERKKENQFHREKNRKIGQISRPDNTMVLPWKEFL